MRRAAVVGAGVSGLVAARALSAERPVDLFEARTRLGGHARTIDVELGGRTLAVETAFVVFNDRAYPEFCRLLDELGVPSRPGPMTFSVRNEASGLEYGGGSLGALFAQRRNLLRPRFFRMLADVLRFGRDAGELLAGDGDGGDPDEGLAAYVARRGYSAAFRDDYLVPMTSAIWSAPPGVAGNLPARLFVRFFDRHGMLDIRDAPQWRVVDGGSRRYVRALAEALPGPVRLGTPVRRVERRGRGWMLRTDDGEAGPYAAVVLALHGDRALELVGSPHPLVREVLGAIRYVENRATVHTDVSLLPRRRRAWSAWNAVVPRGGADRVTITYDMTRLQTLAGEERVLVTLNDDERVAPSRVIERVAFRHPVVTAATARAAARWGEIDGLDGLHFCGAYWGYGFHEDGVVSGLRAARAVEADR